MSVQTNQEIRRLSVSTWFDPFVAIAIILFAFFFLRETALTNVQLVLLITLCTSAYFFISEFSRAQWKWSERPAQKFSSVLARTITKFLGVLVGILAIFFAIWLLPQYHRVAYTNLIAEAVLPFLAFIVPAAFLLILATEYILGEKKDGTFQFGLLAQFRIREIDWRVFGDGVLEWLVRCIFLLINFFAVSSFVSRLRSAPFPSLDGGYVEFVIHLDSLIFMVILFAILPGYIFASRLIGTEIKKIDRTWFGWMITLASYPPLNAAVSSGWTRYVPDADSSGITDGTPFWAFIGGDYPLILGALGFLIILFALFHLWGEAQLGIRSANLSMRGIITTGAFRLTKHPVYVSKCLQWTIIYLPFLNAIGIIDSLRYGLLFLLVCAIFAGRALAEERLLSQDANYVRYGLFMDTHGVFAFVGRMFPCMSYQWRYEYWKRRGFLSN